MAEVLNLSLGINFFHLQKMYLPESPIKKIFIQANFFIIFTFPRLQAIRLARRLLPQAYKNVSSLDVPLGLCPDSDTNIIIKCSGLQTQGWGFH